MKAAIYCRIGREKKKFMEWHHTEIKQDAWGFWITEVWEKGAVMPLVSLRFTTKKGLLNKLDEIKLQQYEKQLAELEEYNAKCTVHERQPISGLQFKINRLKKKLEK